MDFGTYKNYSWKYNFQAIGDLATKKLCNLNSSIPYNSFIFGSSRSTGLYGCYLNQKLQNSNFFHYANWTETIGGIAAKLEFLDSKNYQIDNAVIFFDTNGTFRGDGKINDTDHYYLTKESRFNYYATHYKRFFTNMNIDKIRILAGTRVSDATFTNWESDPHTNDPRHVCTSEVLINYGNKELDSLQYHETIDSLRKVGFFYERDGAQKFLDSQISNREKLYLSRIKEIFDKHNTQYFIIISPLYDQLKFSEQDMSVITKLFGNRVYDFSGVNDLTNDYYNFNPDRRHFHPYVSKLMFDEILYSHGRASSSVATRQTD